MLLNMSTSASLSLLEKFFLIQRTLKLGPFAGYSKHEPETEGVSCSRKEDTITSTTRARVAGGNPET